jgi:hypothetical protein
MKPDFTLSPITQEKEVEDHKFKASLDYISSSRPTWVTVSKKKDTMHCAEKKNYCNSHIFKNI